jgi:hypothetical protein
LSVATNDTYCSVSIPESNTTSGTPSRAARSVTPTSEVASVGASTIPSAREVMAESTISICLAKSVSAAGPSHSISTPLSLPAARAPA